MCIPKRSVESYRAIKEHPETDPDVASSYNVRPYEAVLTWGGPRHMLTWRGRHGDELMNFEAVIDSNEGNIATVRMTNKNGLTFLLGQGRNTQAELLKFIRRYLPGVPSPPEESPELPRPVEDMNAAQWNRTTQQLLELAARCPGFVAGPSTGD